MFFSDYHNGTERRVSMDANENDKRLVKLYLSRNSSAIDETMKVYGKRLMRLALTFLSDTRDAEECVNDTYLKAWNTIPPQKPEDLFSYLARLCRCTAYNIIDKKQAVKRSIKVVELTHEMEECIPDQSYDSIISEKTLIAYLDEFLESLPDDKCIIFVKRYWYGESIDNIAKNMGFSQSKVKTTLHRMRKGLKQFLENKGVSI